jgi:D-glycero-alpha-D-manno-heptose-7-phosphate kinase
MAPVRIDSSAPTRIDLAGGTCDLWPLYLFHEPAQTISVAISLRAHCSLTSRRDYRVVITSEDTGHQIEADDPQSLGTDRMPLAARLVRHFGARGVDARTYAASPLGSGLAESTAMNVALIGALAAWTGRPVSDQDLLTLAINAETQALRRPAGVQDVQPAFYGGVAAVEMGLTGVHREALSVDLAELERRLILAHLGPSRHGLDHWEVLTRRMSGDGFVAETLNELCRAGAALREALEQHAWPAAGAALAAEWQARKRLAPTVTTLAIDFLLERARFAGALAGKACGAGGGGCVVCLIDPDRRTEVSAALTSGGASLLPFTIEREGLTVHRR